MKQFNDILDPEIRERLQAGEVGIIRTDTLYGIVGVATNQTTVERIYTLKHRDMTKAPILLIADESQLFDTPSGLERVMIKKMWPGKVSVILPSSNAPSWIERGNGTVAYRHPDVRELCELLKFTGPLIAPSANLQGQPPARSVQEAVNYFGEAVDFYVDGGEVTTTAPSQLIRLSSEGRIERLR